MTLEHLDWRADTTTELRNGAARPHDGTPRPRDDDWMAAAAAAGVGAYSVDFDSGRATWSPKMVEIHGLPSDDGRLYLDMEQVSRIVHPEDRERFQQHVAESRRLPEGARYESEFRIVRPDGETRWIRNTGVVLFNGEGESRRPVGATGVAIDVTEKKQADEQLRVANERFSATLRASPIIVFSQDLQLRYTSIVYNEAAEFLPNEIVGLTDADLFEPAQARGLELVKREVLETEAPQRREVRLAREGVERWYDLTVSPQRDAAGRAVGVLCAAVDITQRKKTEDTLLNRSQRLALLSEASTELLASDDPRAFLEQLYRRLAALFDLDVYVHYAVSDDGRFLQLAADAGLTDEQRASLARQELGHPLCGTVAETLLPLVVVDAADADDAHTSCMRALGMSAYVCHPLIARGKLFGTLAFGSATAREFALETIDLFRAVSDLVALGIARHQAEQSLRVADRRKNEFLATLAHELRNPLAPIRSAIDIIGLAKDDPATIEAMHPVMTRQVEQLTRLVDDLLEVSRITLGRLELRKGRVDLAAILDSALDETRTLIDTAGHRLEVEIPDEPISFDGDQARLAQVFANLLDNAAKYTPAGGNILLKAEKEAETVRVVVKDDGLGIEPSRLDSVFESFERGRGPVERNHQGLGLGLTLVKQLVQMHGGSVDVRSQGPDRGSEFVVTLPLRAGSGSAGRAPAVGAAGAGDAQPCESRCRVLVVDDNEDAANLLAQIVEMLGHEAHVAFDGFEAVEAAAAMHPHLILLDIGLPRMDGYETARRIRRGSSGRDVLLIALTGWGQDRDRQRAIEAGFDRHFAKPLSRAALDTLLRQARAEIAGPHALDGGRAECS